MPFRYGLCLACLSFTLLSLPGCGAGVQQMRPDAESRPTIGGGYGNASQAVAAPEAKAAETNYQGWKAYQLTNGLVTVVAVPDIGGRVMEYRLGSHPFVWTNPAEYGKLYDPPKTAAERKWHNFGGYKTWPAPQSKWGGPPDPLGSQLEAARWSGKILTASGPTVRITMTSPEDPVTGLQLTRELALSAGSTRLQIHETFRNISQRELTWSIWGICQVPGQLEPSQPFSREARVYIPLNPKSIHADGFCYLIAEKTDQWTKIANGRILQTSYGGKVGKIGTDSEAGWATYVDELHGFTFAQTYTVVPGAEYPDQGSTTEVFTQSSADVPYMELETLAPLKKLAPGEECSYDLDWHCAQVGGPTLKVTSVAALKTFPAAAWKGKQIEVIGEFGVFASGQVELTFRDSAGKSLPSSVPPLKVSPAKSVVLKLTATPPTGATKGMLTLCTEKGDKLGDIAEVLLTNTPAADKD
jgi:hypothetical protein